MSERDQSARRGQPSLLRGFAGWRLADLPPDAAAGFTLAAIAIPEQMATARLAGLPAEAGFVALIAGAIGFALFGASRRLSVGADSTIAPIFAATLGAVATSPADYANLAAALAIGVGIILVIGGLLRFGFIADLLSIPVMTGFLAGIAVHIAVSQAPDALGIARTQGPLLTQAAAAIARLGSANLWTLGLSLGVVALVAACEVVSPRIPGALIAVAGATALSLALGLEARGVAPLGDISAGALTLGPPSLTFQDFRNVAPLAVIIALVAMVQTGATARSFPDAPDGPDVDRDYIGVGIANAVAGFAGAFPVNASPPRTAIVAESGGVSQAASLVAAVIALGVLLFGGSALAHVPRAALAGVLLFVAARIVRVVAIRDIWRRTRAEFLLIFVTAAAMLVLPIEQGVFLGIIASLLHGVWTATRTQAIELQRISGTSIWWPRGRELPQESVPGVRVLSLQAPLSFLNAAAFRESLRRQVDADPPPRLVVIEAAAMSEIDYTGASALAEIIEGARARKIEIALARLESVRAQESLARQGLIALLRPDHVFPSVQQAVDALAGAGKRS